MSRRNGNPQAMGYDRRQEEVHRLLDLAVKEAAGDRRMVTDWIDQHADLEDYGYTKELEEEIQTRKDTAEALFEVFPSPQASGGAFAWETFLDNRTMAEQIQIEHFFQGLVDARKHPRRELPNAGLAPEWDTKQEGKSQALADSVLDLLRVCTLRQAGRTYEARMFLPHAVARAATALERVGRMREACDLVDHLEAGGMQEDPRLAYVRGNLAHLPLEALEWIVRVDKGEETTQAPA